LVKAKKGKKESYDLLTQWKGYGPEGNTWEKLTEKAAEMPELVLQYLEQNQETARDVIKFIKCHNSNQFKETFVKNVLEKIAFFDD
jgi:hypothetical protein